jgi:flagellar hook-length control protein FliK
MGLTVIPSLASASLPGPGTAATAGSEGIAGDFAALLSGELLGLMAGDGKTGKALSLAADSATTDNAAAGAVDPSLFASLFGQGSSEMPERILRDTPLASASEGKALAGNALLARGQADLPADERGLGRTGAKEPNSGLEKFTLANLPSIANAATPQGTAIIAGEGNNADGLPAVAAGMTANTATATVETSTSGNPRTGINAHLHSAAWPQQFGEKIVWLARNDQQSAQLTINPPQLGPIQITLNLSGDQASIAFASPHAEVRQAIENAMPQLKDMLSSAGINLGQSNVGANLSQQRPETPAPGANGTRSADENAILPANDKAANASGSAILHRGRGLVDLFA